MSRSFERTCHAGHKLNKRQKPVYYKTTYCASSCNYNVAPDPTTVNVQVCGCGSGSVVPSAVATRPSRGNNLIKNGGFEILDPGHLVFLNWYNRFDGVTASNQAHEGLLAAQLTTAGPVSYNTEFLLQNVPVQVGGRYQLTFFSRLLRTDGPLTDSQLRAGVYCTMTEVDLIGPIVILDSGVSQNSYTSHIGTMEFSVPAGQSSLTVEFSIYRSTSTSVSASVQHWLVDSVTLFAL